MNTCDHWQSQPPASHTAHRPSVDTNTKMIMGKERKGTWQMVRVGEVTHSVVGDEWGRICIHFLTQTSLRIKTELLNKYYISPCNWLVEAINFSGYGHWTVTYGRPMFHTKTLSQFSGSTCLFPFTRLDLHNVKAFDLRKSLHHHTIQIIQPIRCNSFTSLLLDIYVWLNMFRASPRPSSGA